MSESGKIIEINPELFKISKKSTRKNRNVKEKSNISIPKPIIKTNAFKQKLLKRIQEHKKKENENKKNIHDDDYNNINLDEHYDDEQPNNELDDALNFFETVKTKEKQKQKLLSKTIKHRNNENKPSLNQNISPISNLSINIPHLLKPSNCNTIEINNESTINNESKINKNTDIVNYILDDLPYGCLKNGTKPTYKNWMSGIKKYSEMADSDKINVPRPPTPPKKRDDIEYENTNSQIDIKSEPIIDRYKEAVLKKQINDKLKQIQNEQLKFNNDLEIDTYTEIDNILQIDDKNKEPEKQYIKKTIKKKYIVGKSNKYRKVGILIKGRQTKRNIMNSHKSLKRTDIHQIKKYLKKRGMLKIGSNCPDEILRKMYESLILSGDIKNVNEDILIHNFLNDSEQIK